MPSQKTRRRNAAAPALVELPPYDDDGALNAVVETPRGSTYKMKFEPRTGSFHYQHPLPLGLAYPYDWGFVPGTLAPDGDPLDVLVLHDAGTHPGVRIPSRILGVVRVSQKEDGEPRTENDRVIAAPLEHAAHRRLSDVPKKMRKELEDFFLACASNGKKASLVGWGGRKKAQRAVEGARRAFKKRHKKR
jgi:inorganic pyrophosphatase